MQYGEKIYHRNPSNFLQKGLTREPTSKGLERPCLIGLTVAGFDHAWTKTKAHCVEARRDEYFMVGFPLFTAGRMNMS